MPAEVVQLAATAAPAAGSAAAPAAPAAAPGIGASLAALGTAVKAFVLANPVGIAAVGGALVGAGAYYAFTRLRSKPAAATEAPAAA